MTNLDLKKLAVIILPFIFVPIVYMFIVYFIYQISGFRDSIVQNFFYAGSIVIPGVYFVVLKEMKVNSIVRIVLAILFAIILLIGTYTATYSLS